MSLERSKCQLLEANGERLATAICRLSRTEGGWTALLTGFDAPGQIVRRCLLGHIREVWIRAGAGVACPGRIEQVYFDPSAGRCCRLRLEEGAALLLAFALSTDPRSASATPP
jgi:hypothetical protein